MFLALDGLSMRHCESGLCLKLFGLLRFFPILLTCESETFGETEVKKSVFLEIFSFVGKTEELEKQVFLYVFSGS